MIGILRATCKIFAVSTLLITFIAHSFAVSANTPDNVLVVGQIAEPKSLDPATVTAVNDFRILMNMYDGLVRYKNGSLVTEFLPGLIVPSDIIIDGLLCSNKADKVPTGGLSQATTAIVPSKPLALKCSQIASLVTSRPISEYLISLVPFLMPSEVAIVYSG